MESIFAMFKLLYCLTWDKSNIYLSIIPALGEIKILPPERRRRVFFNSELKAYIIKKVRTQISPTKGPEQREEQLFYYSFYHF
jgi:hypothetical protein